MGAVVATLHRLTVAVVILCITVFVPTHSNARDDGRFADSPLKEWFEHLRSTSGLCCAFADGVSLQDVDWDTQDGHYRVRIQGEWFVVPDDAVVTEPNRFWPVGKFRVTAKPASLLDNPMNRAICDGLNTERRKSLRGQHRSCQRRCQLRQSQPVITK